MSDVPTLLGKMSTLTTEWMSKISESSIRYDVLINDFQKKIKNSGRRSIHSRVFRIGRSKFQINIYPNGDKAACKGKVGVFLSNQSDWRVKLEVSFEAANRYDGCEKLENYFDVGESQGFPTFVDHIEDCTYGSLGEGTFELQTTITLLEEEVTPERDMTGVDESIQDTLNDQGRTLSSMKEEMAEMRSNIRGIRDELTDLQRQQRRELSAVQRGIEDLKLCLTGRSATRAAGGQDTKKVLECPMCTEEARPPMRLRQCREGHIICDGCFARDEQARERYEYQKQYDNV